MHVHTCGICCSSHSKQCEKHYPNGTKEIRFPNDTVKYIYSNGEEESVFPDGLSQRNYPNGDVILHMPNGIKECYTSVFKVSLMLYATVHGMHSIVCDL